jgi:twitching motility protein PilT
MDTPREKQEFLAYLSSMTAMGASDLHLKVGAPPTFRIDGTLFPMNEPSCSTSDLEKLIGIVLDPRQREHFTRELELDVAFSLPGVARYRVNVCCQRGTVGASFRLVPMTIPSLEELHLPPVLGDLVQVPHGLILVTGSTGSGKSTTVASMLEHVNNLVTRKVVTIEDPIEYLHRDHQCLIYQREIGQDTHSFAHALRHILRQDPDIIMIGEIRDVETLTIALNAANTGHLVITTLHTADAVQSIQRILTYYAPHEQDEIRRVLADNLSAVVSQRLLPQIGGQGRLAAVEVMVNTSTIKEYIINPEKTGLIRDTIKEGATQYRMQSFDQALASMVMRNLVTAEVALHYATQPTELALHLQGFSGASNRVWSDAELSALDKPLPPKEPEWLEDESSRPRRRRAA